MKYTDLLTQYGSPCKSASHALHINIRSPASLNTPAEVADYDRWTVKDISRLESYLEGLKDYRQALAARYAQLETMAYTRLLRLERCAHWKGHIEYVITITRTMEDGTQTRELREVYAGKERKKAFDRFAALQKQFPGIPAEKDIEKKYWEK